MQSVQIHHNQIGTFAHLKRPGNLLNMTCPCPTDGRHRQRSFSRYCQWVAGVPLGQQRHQPHFLKMIKVVITGRAVGANAHHHANIQHILGVGNATGKLKVGSGVMTDTSPSIFEHPHFALVNPHTMRRNHLGLEHTTFFDPIHHRHAVLGTAILHFLSSFGNVNMQRHIMF